MAIEKPDVTAVPGDVRSFGLCSFRFAVKLRNSAGVLPQLYIGTVGHLLSTFLRRVVVGAFEIDSPDVLPVAGDKIRAIVGHRRLP